MQYSRMRLSPGLRSSTFRQSNQRTTKKSDAAKNYDGRLADNVSIAFMYRGFYQALEPNFATMLVAR
jgi:hypothetical protein